MEWRYKRGVNIRNKISRLEEKRRRKEGRKKNKKIKKKDENREKHCQAAFVSTLRLVRNFLKFIATENLGVKTTCTHHPICSHILTIIHEKYFTTLSFCLDK